MSLFSFEFKEEPYKKPKKPVYTASPEIAECINHTEVMLHGIVYPIYDECLKLARGDRYYYRHPRVHADKTVIVDITTVDTETSKEHYSLYCDTCLVKGHVTTHDKVKVFDVIGIKHLTTKRFVKLKDYEEFI